jgi:histidinol-phosphate phosphatase family protein
MRPAAFLDRDGTLMLDVNYIADPAEVVLVPGAASAVRRLNGAGIITVVVTNQSGIALGLLTEADYEAVRLQLEQLLHAEGARLDASFHCPHHPDVSGLCDCRKPGLGLYRRAAAELGLDLARSLYVGDRYRDIQPGLELGGFARLVPSVASPPGDVERAAAAGLLARTLEAAVEEYLASGLPPSDRPY